MTDPIDWVANWCSTVLKEMNPDETIDREVMEYALALTINAVLTIGLSLLLGYMLGHFVESAGVLIIFAIMRILAKGAHVKSLTVCVILTAFLVVLIAVIPFSPFIVLPAGVFCIVMIISRSSVARWRKGLACSLVASLILINAPMLLMACCFQAVTLFPIRR